MYLIDNTESDPFCTLKMSKIVGPCNKRILVQKKAIPYIRYVGFY